MSTTSNEPMLICTTCGETIPLTHHFYMCADCETNWCARNPWAWYKARMEYHREQGGSDPNDHVYLVTFTKRPDMPNEQWLKRVKFELGRKFVRSFKCCLEHKDSNIHAHAKIVSKTLIKISREYRTYSRNYGWIDIRNVTHDNGVDIYLEKEIGGKVFTKIEEIEI